MDIRLIIDGGERADVTTEVSVVGTRQVGSPRTTPPGETGCLQVPADEECPSQQRDPHVDPDMFTLPVRDRAYGRAPSDALCDGHEVAEGYKGRPPSDSVFQFFRSRQKNTIARDMFIENFPPMTLTPVTFTEYLSYSLNPRHRATLLFLAVKNYNAENPGKPRKKLLRENATPLADLVLETIGSGLNPSLDGLKKPLAQHFASSKDPSRGAKSDDWTLDQLHQMQFVAQTVRQDASYTVKDLVAHGASELVQTGVLGCPINAPDVLAKHVRWMSKMRDVATRVESLLRETVIWRCACAELQIKHGGAHIVDGVEYYLFSDDGTYRWVNFECSKTLPY
jgi:hypothetical protein